MSYPNAPRNPLNTAELLPKPWQRALYRPVQPLVERWFDFNGAWKLYADAGGDPAEAGPFARDILRLRSVEWSLPETDLAKLRALDGPLVIAANHPYGGIDSFILIDLLEQIRPGNWKIFSNQILKNVRPLIPHRIPVDALGMSEDGYRTNARAMRTALQHLRQDGCLALFPARRVAYRDSQLGAVVDFDWSDHAVKLAARTGAHLACLHFPGHNSERFLRIPREYPRLRGLLLCRELTQSPARKLPLRIATMLDPKDTADLTKDPRAAQKLHARVHLQDDLRAFPGKPTSESREEDPASADREEADPHMQLPFRVGHSSKHSGVGAKAEGSRPTSAMTAAPDAAFRLFKNGTFEVYLFRGDKSPQQLDTLGRARSVTFRAADQGTGKEIDLSPEDNYYHHLVVWDTEAGCLAGAYRIGIVPEILRDHGQSGLYLDHVFHIDPAFFERFPHSMELSRSFVLPDYQKDNRVLPLLWKGLAAASDQHAVDTLFGSVTISNAHHAATRALLVEYLKKNYADDPEAIRLIRAREPFVPETRYHPLVAEAYAGEGINALNPLIQEIEGGERAIPPLMRYYCQLGAKYIDYHVEADFGNALYCLLRVHLPSIPEGYKKRFSQ
ncbi:MAG: GNAT family N-acetyltransferase [Verrucomicrobia bacterium]|nr:GNAT family N-acetyltransferase [Verrucomicrobiota bacterium]